MDGEQYVHLLYDDGTFRRSRFYFWAIGCLSSFEQSVAETLWELDRFRTEVDDKSKPGIRAASETQGPKNIYKQEMENYDQAKKNLEGIRDQLAKKRDEMKVLRDGVCLQICNTCHTRTAQKPLHGLCCTTDKIVGISEWDIISNFILVAQQSLYEDFWAALVR